MDSPPLLTDVMVMTIHTKYLPDSSRVLIVSSRTLDGTFHIAHLYFGFDEELPTWGSEPLLHMACMSPLRFNWFLFKMI